MAHCKVSADTPSHAKQVASRAYWAVYIAASPVVHGRSPKWPHTGSVISSFVQRVKVSNILKFGAASLGSWGRWGHGLCKLKLITLAQNTTWYCNFSSL